MEVININELEAKVLEVLSKESDWITAKDITKKLGVGLGYNKSNVNAVLYSFEHERKIEKISGTPPLWRSLIPNENTSEDKENDKYIPCEETHVFIDVNNSPCLEQACSYAKDNVFILL